jgi:hypothetical protein
MRYSNDLSVLILAACFLGAMSCSDDGDGSADQPQAGAAGSAGAAGAAGSGGAAGAAGAAGSGGSGSDSLAEVGFSDVHPLLVDNCGECHGGSFLPAFAQDDEDAAYQVTQDDSSYPDEPYYERIIVRATEELTMPPGCFGDLGSTGCLSVEDAALLEAWVDQGALR